MIKRITIFLLCVLVFTFGCQHTITNNKISESKEDHKPTIAVSIVPQQTFVQAVAGDTVNIITMIPPGFSPANYQPTPEQLIAISKANIIFTMGLSVERDYVIPIITEHNKDCVIVSLANAVDAVYPPRYLSTTPEQHCEQVRDPHIWLSPKRALLMVETIAKELIKLKPNQKSTYKKNSQEYISKLNLLQNSLQDKLENIADNSFIIYHPSYGYFADDYNLNMVAIEASGKEATSQDLKKIVDFAKKENIKYIFYQEEFDNEQAKTISQEIKGKAIKVTPLAPNYIESLELLANQLTKHLR